MSMSMHCTYLCIYVHIRAYVCKHIYMYTHIHGIPPACPATLKYMRPTEATSMGNNAIHVKLSRTLCLLMVAHMSYGQNAVYEAPYILLCRGVVTMAHMGLLHCYPLRRSPKRRRTSSIDLQTTLIATNGTWPETQNT